MNAKCHPFDLARAEVFLQKHLLRLVSDTAAILAGTPVSSRRPLQKQIFPKTRSKDMREYFGKNALFGPSRRSALRLLQRSQLELVAGRVEMQKILFLARTGWIAGDLAVTVVGAGLGGLLMCGLP
jgi:hypothetical protein